MAAMHSGMMRNDSGVLTQVGINATAATGAAAVLLATRERKFTLLVQRK